MWQSLKALNVFITLTLTYVFCKTSRSENLEYRFLVESITNESAMFSYKGALLDATVKIKRMWSTKLTYHKEQGFVSNYFIFLKI